MRPIVVKLGGSLAEGARLRGVLAVLARAGRGRVVVVPGGGSFADAVRAAQAAHHFSDPAAHRMAIQAMEQFAVMLADLEPALLPCGSADEIAAALEAGRVPVWLPSAMALADPAIAQSWAVTSDSLAAWLAQRLGAPRLVLLKSAPLPAGGPADWTRQRYVDAAFADFAAEGPADIRAIGPDSPGSLEEALQLEEHGA